MSSKAQTREKDYERGIRIADRRKAIGLSQDELAHRVGIGRQALSAIENGGDFKTQTLDNLAIVLGVSVDFIMYGKNEENSELLSEARMICLWWHYIGKSISNIFGKSTIAYIRFRCRRLHHMCVAIHFVLIWLSRE